MLPAAAGVLPAAVALLARALAAALATDAAKTYILRVLLPGSASPDSPAPPRPVLDVWLQIRSAWALVAR